MLLKKLAQTVAQWTLGKDVALALTVLGLIRQTLESRTVSDISRFVYRQLPIRWQAPQGPATESEFIELVQAGQVFLIKIRAVLKP